MEDGRTNTISKQNWFTLFFRLSDAAFFKEILPDQEPYFIQM